MVTTGSETETGVEGSIHMVNVSSVGQVYVCNICGNVVEVKEVGGGELVCCGEPMELKA
jgi:desulfoferrodoxin-like iron-binding protein